MAREVFQCRTCGHSLALEPADCDGLHCPVCNEVDTYERINFNGGYDKPHFLNLYVRASSLERAAGEEDLPKSLERAFCDADVGEAEDLRDVAAMIEQRLRELDVERMADD